MNYRKAHLTKDCFISTRLFDLLTGQVLAGLCFTGNGECTCCTELQREEAALIAAKFISNLPGMRRVLATDVAAAYNGDPAAHSFGEVISCYPAIREPEPCTLGPGRSLPVHRQPLHHRPRNGCGNWGDVHHRK